MILLDPRLIGQEAFQESQADLGPPSDEAADGEPVCRLCRGDVPSTPNPPPIPDSLAADMLDIADVEMLEELQRDSEQIERLTANPDCTDQERRLALFDHKLAHLAQKFASFFGRQQEVAEMELWNADAASSLMAVTERFRRIPFPLPSEIYNLAPTSEQKCSAKGKEKENSSAATSSVASSSVNPKVPVMFRDPVKFQQEWWYHTMPHVLDVKDDKYTKPISSMSYVGPHEHRVEVFVEPIRRKYFDEGFECPCGTIFEELFTSHVQECGSNMVYSKCHSSGAFGLY